MLSRYAERRGFKTEPLSVADGDYTFAVKGQGAYSVFKYEGGTHRVQRVPETESQGRIHTSTATVAVLPEAEEVEVQIDPNDLQIDVYRSSGPGGQSVNTTDSRRAHHPQAHRPGGVDAGREVPAAEPREGDARAARAAARAASWPRSRPSWRRSGGRRWAPASARRRSAPTTSRQDRVTDHRVKLTKGERRSGVLAGELDEFTAALEADEKRRKLEASAGGMTDGRAPPATRSRRPRTLAAAGCETPRLDAEVLLADALGVDRARADRRSRRSSSPAAARALIGERIRRRRVREPVAYILGRKGFRHIELAVDPRVLIPRPGDRAAGGGGAGAAPQGARVHDVGTGSGRGGAGAEATSGRTWSSAPRTLAGGGRGGARQRRAARARRRGAPARAARRATYDLVVANLPYVREDEWAALAPEIRVYEPREALRRRRRRARRDPRAGARGAAGHAVALEHAPDQAAAVRALLADAAPARPGRPRAGDHRDGRRVSRVAGRTCARLRALHRRRRRGAVPGRHRLRAGHRARVARGRRAACTR